MSDGPALAARNPRIQRLRRLLGRRSARVDEGAFVVEGPSLLADALAARWPLEAVYAEVGHVDPVLDDARDAGVEIVRVAEGVVARVADAVSPRPLLAVAERRVQPLPSVLDRDLLVVAAPVTDPGNLGTVLRSAEAAGAGAVVCGDGSVDPFSPKCVRASAGALFLIDVVVGGEIPIVLTALRSEGIQTLATVPAGGVPYDRADLTRPSAIVVGHEAHGLTPEALAAADVEVSIPMVGRAESLNVAIAASLLVFEAARQRRAVAG